MIVVGVDIGGATTNGITVMNENMELIFHTSVEYNKKEGKGSHRRKLSHMVSGLVQLYSADMVLVERVKQFKGKFHSKISNIESLVRVVCGIIDSCYDKCEIFDVQVGSWKSQVFGFNTDDKQVSLDYVYNKYGLVLEHHDEADSIGIATYGVMNFNSLMEIAKNPKLDMVGSVCLTRN